MNSLTTGSLWALAFVVIEALQFVYFGGLFQEISTFLFGFLVFGIVTVLFVVASALRHPGQLRLALANPRRLIVLNIFATLAWASYLNAVKLIEPAIVYTISAGVMPLAAWSLARYDNSADIKKENKPTLIGMSVLLLSILYLSFITLNGSAGFVRAGVGNAVFGVVLAISDGIFFSLMLAWCGKLDRLGIGPSVIFGLRFPLYVASAGVVSWMGLESMALPSGEKMLLFVALGLLLTVPHLFALQKAISQISTTHIGILTTLGPFVVFFLQILEGRVSYSTATLMGLVLFFIGSLLAVRGMILESEQLRHPDS